MILTRLFIMTCLKGAPCRHYRFSFPPHSEHDIKVFATPEGFILFMNIVGRERRQSLIRKWKSPHATYTVKFLWAWVNELLTYTLSYSTERKSYKVNKGKNQRWCALSI